MNIKLTPKRKEILAVLQNCHSTLSASEIHDQLPHIDLTTVYRNLDLFVKEKLIKEVNLSTEEAQYEFQRIPHHHAICTDCNKILHFTAPNDKLKKLFGLEKFLVDEIEVTVKGRCQKKSHAKR